MMRLFVCICYDYICGLAGICMCIMMTFACAKDSSIKPVSNTKQICRKKQKTTKISSSEWRTVSSSAVVAIARTGEASYSYYQ